MSNQKIDLNKFRVNTFEQSEFINKQPKDEEYIDLQNFLKSKANKSAGSLNKFENVSSIKNTQKLLDDIDKLINKSDEDFLSSGNHNQDNIEELIESKMAKFEEFKTKYSENAEQGKDWLGDDLNKNEESNESIYGIRTNINAVVEYCHLLIKYLLENYLEYLAQKFTFIRLCRESKDLFGFDVSYKKIQKFGGESSSANQLFTAETNIKPEPDLLKAPVTLANLEPSKTPNNTPENPDKDATPKNSASILPSNKLCWSKKTEKKMILTEQTYLALENQILSTYESMNINESLFSMQKIYHRCVFDAFNEIMTAFIRQDRFFKLNMRDRNIMKLSVFSQDDVEYILAKTQTILIEYTQQQCGILKDKEDSMMDSFMRTVDPVNLSRTRKERMIRSCNYELKENPENEYQWLPRKQEVMMIIADLITDYLLEDCAGFLIAPKSI